MQQRDKTISGLDDLTEQGNQLLKMQDASSVKASFDQWIKDVGAWLQKVAPDSGLLPEWIAVNTFESQFGGKHIDSMMDDVIWSSFRTKVKQRLEWLSKTPAKIQSSMREEGTYDKDWYINPGRIEEIEQLTQKNFDLSKLVRFCEELNICHANNCFLAMIMLTRAILDHVPPIFNCKTFAEVASASNYKGSKSFKDLMERLEKSSRKIADQHLHIQIGKTEILPTFQQVNFAADIDMLLAEIIRILKS